MTEQQQDPKVDVIENHKGAIHFEDVDGTTHVRVTVDDIFLDTPEGTALMEDLQSRNVRSNAVHMLMSIIRGLSDHSMSTTVPGEYNESTVH